MRYTGRSEIEVRLAVFETQAAFIVTHRPGEEAFYLEHESLEDMGRNADLYFSLVACSL